MYENNLVDAYLDVNVVSTEGNVLLQLQTKQTNKQTKTETNKAINKSIIIAIASW